MRDITLYGHEKNILPTKYWPCADAKATLLIIHGFGEHCGRYAGMAQAMNAQGVEVYGYDQRGHGANPLGPRGCARAADLEKDILAVLDALREKSDLPLFLLGHSLGGGLVAYTLAHSQPSVRAAILCSPWFELVSPLPELPVKILKKHPKILGKASLRNAVPQTGLCHDEAVLRAYLEDPLVVDHIAFTLAADMLSAADYSLTHADRVLVPVLMSHGSEDGICSPEGSRKFAAQCPKADLHIFEGAYHEVHNEPEAKDALFALIGSFILENL